jgi:hypothetical protein
MDRHWISELVIVSFRPQLLHSLLVLRENQWAGIGVASISEIK